MLQEKARDVVFEGIVPVVGMAFFWAFMRYQTFFGVLFPLSVPKGGAAGLVGSPVLFLSLLLAMTLAALAARRGVERLFCGNFAVPLLCSLGGSAGTVLVMGAGAGWPAALGAVGCVLVCAGFLSVLCLWGCWFSRGFGPGELVVVAAGYLSSLLLFARSPSPPDAFAGMGALVVLAPALSGACWLVASRASSGRRDLGAPFAASPPESAEVLRPPLRTIGLFVVFLLAGSVVRGVVDATGAAAGVRRAISLPCVAILVAACAAYALACRGDAGEEGRRDRAGVFALGCWTAFSLMFVAGLFAFLVLDEVEIGGNLVVVARSMLEVALWMLVCDLVCRGALAPIPAFLCCEALVEAASWGLSYVLVPAVLSVDEGSSTTLVLSSVFGLVSVATVLLGAAALVGGFTRPGENPGEHPACAGQTRPPAAAARDWEGVAGELASSRGLTFREASVAVRYAHGYSIAKVSEELGVSLSAAQSSIRSVYRKLGVHTKNDLIEAVDSLTLTN